MKNYVSVFSFSFSMFFLILLLRAKAPPPPSLPSNAYLLQHGDFHDYFNWIVTPQYHYLNIYDLVCGQMCFELLF